jgi:hypothetical protein
MLVADEEVGNGYWRRPSRARVLRWYKEKARI